jgi:uncharacterized protein YjbJ (UPF0337 family)
VQIMRRIANVWQRLVGNLKVAFGRLSGNRRVVTQGRSDQVKARVKDARDNARVWRRKWVRS